jgi:hypothetical protein
MIGRITINVVNMSFVISSIALRKQATQFRHEKPPSSFFAPKLPAISFFSRRAPGSVDAFQSRGVPDNEDDCSLTSPKRASLERDRAFEESYDDLERIMGSAMQPPFANVEKCRNQHQRVRLHSAAWRRSMTNSEPRLGG